MFFFCAEGGKIVLKFLNGITTEVYGYSQYNVNNIYNKNKI